MKTKKSNKKKTTPDNHKHTESCFACEHGTEALEAFELKSIEDYGWYCHYVPSEDYDNSPTGVNIHTHHIQESFNHPDLQIVIPLSQHTVLAVLHEVVNNFIKKGVKFKVGKKYKKIIGNEYSVVFTNAKECGRDVLRMIIPDKNGYLKENEPMDEQFKIQHILKKT